LQIADAFRQANNKEFNRQKDLIAGTASNVQGADKKKADSLARLSQTNFAQAAEWRKKADAAGGDFHAKKDFLKQAYELEIAALRQQREALVIYTGKDQDQEALAMNAATTPAAAQNGSSAQVDQNATA